MEEEEPELFRLIRAKDTKGALELIASGNSNPEVIRSNVFLSSNQTADEVTPLIFACVHKLSEVALALIATNQSNPGVVFFLKTTHSSLEASLEFTTVSSHTALTLACTNKLPEVALALIATGESNISYESKDAISGDIYTALILACSNKLQEVALALIATGETRSGIGINCHRRIQPRPRG